jgi:hypothetical protein
MTHELKTWPEYFEEIWNGKKKFELRENDRDFKTGDIILLREYCQKTNTYWGRMIRCVVQYVLSDFPGIEKGYAILSLGNMMFSGQTINNEMTLTIDGQDIKAYFNYKKDCRQWSSNSIKNIYLKNDCEEDRKMLQNWFNRSHRVSDIHETKKDLQYTTSDGYVGCLYGAFIYHIDDNSFHIGYDLQEHLGKF